MFKNISHRLIIPKVGELGKQVKALKEGVAAFGESPHEIADAVKVHTEVMENAMFQARAYFGATAIYNLLLRKQKPEWSESEVQKEAVSLIQAIVASDLKPPPKVLAKLGVSPEVLKQQLSRKELTFLGMLGEEVTGGA